MSNVSVKLEGSLLLQPATCNGAMGTGNVGPVFALGLRMAQRSAEVEVSQIITTIDSTDAYVALPWPAGLHATTFYLRTADFPSGWSLRLTYESSGQKVLPVHGTVLLEAPVDDRITAAELQGSGQFGWAAAGTIE
ncbi:MAG TPA: hypothetical protein VM869_35840 [Enhygromyxa sp.]|nr:hypothetical protein [Enhygromyxa sp.]